MTDNNFEKPGKDGEPPTEVDSSAQFLSSLRRQRRSRRSRTLVILLCFGLGILVLAIFLVLKPETEKVRTVEKQVKHPALSIEAEEEATLSGNVEEKRAEQQPSEGQSPIVSRSPETPLVSPGSGEAEKVDIIGGGETRKGAKGKELTGTEEKKPDTQSGEGEKFQVARATAPKSPAIAEEGAPIGGFTINVGSFRERVRAERLMNELNEKGYDAFVAKATLLESGTWYRVSVGRFPSPEAAQAFAQELKQKNGIDSFVRKIEGPKT